jgi:Acyl-CoA dehydrogenase, C-terminal domain
MQDRRLHKFIIITIIVPFAHDSVIHRENALGDGARTSARSAATDGGAEISRVERRIALSNLEAGRIGIAAQCVGMAESALAIAVGYAKERKSMGKAIINHQAVGFRLADLATRLEAARQLVLHAASLKDAGLPCLKEAAMAKLFASDTAQVFARAQCRRSAAMDISKITM